MRMSDARKLVRENARTVLQRLQCANPTCTRYKRWAFADAARSPLSYVCARCGSHVECVKLEKEK